MKRFLTTTATVLVLSTSAFGQSHTGAFADMTFDAAVNLNASELIGKRIYASEAEINNETRIAADGEKEWDDIGEINEIILTREGEVQSVIVGVGGFLGIGEKDVAINMDQLKFVSEEGESEDYFLVVNADVAGVENAPAYMSDASGSMDHSDDMNADAMADVTAEEALDDINTGKVDDTAMNDDMTDPAMTEGVATDMNEVPMMTAPALTRDGYATAEADALTAEDLTGARVYGINDEDVGEVSELLLTDDGKLDRAVIDVGGFLGLGEHPVAISLEELQILRADDGSSLRVYIESSQEMLEQKPEYES